MPKIFYATDVHGSEVCWRKFLNAGPFSKADILILGGDITGKAIVPIVESDGKWETTLQEYHEVLESEEEVEAIEKKIINRGYYPARMSREEYLALKGDEKLVAAKFKEVKQATEEKLGERIDRMLRDAPDFRRTIFNFHAPPYGSNLDEAPALDADMKFIAGGRAMRAVGSKAVRDSIMEYQPLMSLHGHIHESKGGVKLGKTLAVNPGSAYEEGTL